MILGTFGSLRLAIPFTPPPPPEIVEWKRGNVYENLTLNLFYDVILVQENI